MNALRLQRLNSALTSAVLAQIERLMIVVCSPKVDWEMPSSWVTGTKNMLAVLMGSDWGNMSRHVPKNTMYPKWMCPLESRSSNLGVPAALTPMLFWPPLRLISPSKTIRHSPKKRQQGAWGRKPHEN